MPDPVYLDHAATSPVDPRVAAAMQPWLLERFGNASALYAAGREALAAIEQARDQVAAALHCRPAEVLFTSGGTESNNAALKGIALARMFARLGAHVVVSSIEHHAVLYSADWLERFGCAHTVVDCDERGRIEPSAVAAALRPDTALVSVMLANNEVGAVQPLAAIVAAVRERATEFGVDIPVHTDAVQAARWLPLDVDALGVDALSLSAHKFGGPAGVGVLYLRRGVPFLEQLSGGGQERQRRAGTENVAGMVGAGLALELAQREREQNIGHVAVLRARLVAGITAALPEARLVGDPESSLPNIATFALPGVEGEPLIRALDAHGVAASSGAACASVSWEPSHVLLAMGLPLDVAAGAVRFSLGPESTAAEIDAAVAALPAALAEARALAVG
jgi:cysteine desulfurase